MNMNSEQAKLKFLLEKIVDNIDKVDVTALGDNVLAAEVAGVRISIQLEGEKHENQ